MDVSKPTVLEFLEGSRKVFKIPVYQRNYAWEPKQCSKLIEDVILSNQKDSESYFVGCIVSFKTGKKYNDDGTTYDEILIIDGQQRLITISIILIAIMNLIKDEFLKEEIKRNYLINERAKEKSEYRMKLKTVKNDHQFFKKLLDGAEKTKESKIINNYISIEKTLQRYSQKKLREFYESLRKLSVVSITVYKTEHPQLIFESLNSTGMSLEQSDLIRNYILMERSDQEKLHDNHWAPIERNVGSEIDNFMRHYLTLKIASIPPKKGIYEKFKIFFEKNWGREKTEELLKELKKYSGYYGNLLRGDFKEKKIASSFKNFVKLDAKVTYPFILGVLDDYYGRKEITEATVVKIFKHLETFLFRRIVCKFATNALDDIFETLYKKLISFYKDGENDYFEVFKYLLNDELKDSSRFPKDNEFKEWLLRKDFYRLAKHKKYFFEKIENYGAKETILGKPSVERIMPKSLKHWREYLGHDVDRIHEQYLNTIGNMTLVHEDHNSEMLHFPFKKKKEILKKSGYRLNKYIIEKEKWGEAEMKERGKMLRNKALKIWPYEKSNFIPTEEEKNSLNFSDIEDHEELTGKKIEAYEFLIGKKWVNNWNKFYYELVLEIYQYDEYFLRELAENDQEIKFISSNENAFKRSNKKIAKEIYLDTHASAAQIMKNVDTLIDKFEDLEKSELTIYLKSEENGE